MTAVVGAAEAAEILGVKTPQVTRWARAGRMPPTVAELHATPVWLRCDVEAKNDGNGWPMTREQHLILGLREVAERLGVDKSQVGRWRRTGKFPEPNAVLRATPVWDLAAIAAWEADRAAALDAA